MLSNNTNARSGPPAIILNAGQGRRLLPLTADRPKCLLEIHGRTVLEWQLRALFAGGVNDAVIVVGFGADQVETELKTCCPAGMRVETIFNPLFDSSDNLVSCLSARAAMTRDFLLLNGDTLFQPGIITRLLQSQTGSVSMAVACKDSYDDDDMKVQRRDGRVMLVGKDLARDKVDGEAIGVCIFRGQTPKLFVEALEEVMARPDGHARWYLSAIGLMAARGLVHGVGTGNLSWMEIDTPEDLARAQAAVPSWPELDDATPEPLSASA